MTWNFTGIDGGTGASTKDNLNAKWMLIFFIVAAAGSYFILHTHTHPVGGSAEENYLGQS